MCNRKVCFNFFCLCLQSNVKLKNYYYGFNSMV